MYRKPSGQVFRGYRIHPCYIERVSNFALNLKPIEPVEQTQPEEAVDPYAQDMSRGGSRGSTTGSRVDASRTSGSRKVTSSDLRNKRNQINNGSHQPVQSNTMRRAGNINPGMNAGRRKGPSYSVQMAIENGSYMADSA
jgi:hypothetical protein